MMPSMLELLLHFRLCAVIRDTQSDRPSVTTSIKGYRRVGNTSEEYASKLWAGHEAAERNACRYQGRNNIVAYLGL